MQFFQVISWLGYGFLLLLFIGVVFASGYSWPAEKSSFIPGFVVGFVLSGFYWTSFLIALPFALVSFTGYLTKRKRSWQ